MKIVGVGYPRTGTKSLRQCFWAFGYKNASWDDEAYALYTQGRIDEVMDRAVGYDSFEDLPWCCLFREFDRRFAGSKFILTRRRSERAWYESERKHESRIEDREFWPASGPLFEKETSGYRNHNAAVREYFKDRPQDLLEVCWEEGDGWTELAAFLGREVPDMPFPHANRTPVENTFQIFHNFLRDLVQTPLALQDDAKNTAALKELIETLPALLPEHQATMIDLLDELSAQTTRSGVRLTASLMQRDRVIAHKAGGVTRLAS